MEILTFCKNQGADLGNLEFLISLGLSEFGELDDVEIDDLETCGLKLDLSKTIFKKYVLRSY